jgi:hypothetical protein
MLIVNWLLARKVEFDDDIDSTIAGSMTINRFNPARLVFMSQTWTWFSNVISSALYCLRSEVIIRFVDIGGIVDHHWLGKPGPSLGHKH